MKQYIAQEDRSCFFCDGEIPKGDWHYQTEDELVCSSCAEAIEAQNELAMEDAVTLAEYE